MSRRDVWTMVGITLVFLWVCLWVSGGLGQRQQTTADVVNDFHQAVAEDFEKQYWIAAKGTDKMQICHQAGLVATAHLQAHNEASYKEWDYIRQARCADAAR